MTKKPIDLDHYFPYFLGTISNRWTSTSSQLYLERFDIGICEWRVLASIRALGPVSAQEVRNLTSMDAAAISRSLKKLEAKGLVELLEGRFVGRTKPFVMTASGRKLYDRIIVHARKREETLLQDLSVDERDQLLVSLRKILNRLEEL